MYIRSGGCCTLYTRSWWNGIQSQFKLESVNQMGKGARVHPPTRCAYPYKHTHAYVRAYKLCVYTHAHANRTCRPPPRRKLPFAVNLIRVLLLPPPPCPSYERVTDARWPFRLCTHNFIPPGHRSVAVVENDKEKGLVGWLAGRRPFCVRGSPLRRVYISGKESFSKDIFRLSPWLLTPRLVCA